MKLKISLIILCIFFTINLVKAQLPAGFAQWLVTDALDEPTSIVASNNGEVLFVTEKKGSVRIIKNGTLLASPLISLVVDNYGERGLQRILLDPGFETNGFFYLYYSVPGENHNRLSKFTAHHDMAELSSEVILIDLDQLFAGYHNGGSMLFGQDGKLYIATGDGTNSSKSQELTSTLGKVLRINSDGTIPDDNPYRNQTAGVYQSIYAMGIRNPFSMTIHSETGKVIFCDVGHASFEEVNILYPKKNYGWPYVEGFLGSDVAPVSDYQDPLYAYDHEEGCAVVGATFFPPGTGFPEDFDNKFLFADYCNNKIYVIDHETGNQITTLTPNAIGIVGLLSPPGGPLHIISIQQGSLWRITYSDDPNPVITQQPRSVELPLGEHALFEIAATGPTLKYQWKKNGLDIPGATTSALTYSNVTMDDNGTEISCIIYNDNGEVESDIAVLTVINNTKPQVYITEPSPSLLYTAGDTISIKGYSTDTEDGATPKSQLSWKVDFHHKTHSHPFIDKIDATDSLGIVIPVIGETSSEVWYRVYLTATDNEGTSNTVHQDIHPKKINLILQTVPQGIALNFNGETVDTPIARESVINLQQTLVAPKSIVLYPTLYVFDNWNSLFTDSEITFSTPEKDSTFIASYTALPLGNGNGLLREAFNKQKSVEGNADAELVEFFEINSNWGLGKPYGYFDADAFSLRWTGFIEVPVSGNYTFYAEADDGARLWIDDVIIADTWSGNSTEGSISLLEGELYRIRLDFFDEESTASISLYWSSDVIPKSLVPRYQLYANSSPKAIIESPDNEFKFTLGENFVVKGYGTDNEDGVIDKSHLTWKLDFFNGTTFENVFPETSNLDSINFHVPENPTYNNENIYYTIYLTATDSHGVTRTVSKEIYPKNAMVSITSNIENIPIKIEDVVVTTPFDTTLVAGTILTLTVLVDDQTMSFVQWPDGSTDETVKFLVPQKDTTLFLTFDPILGAHIPERMYIIHPNPSSNTIHIHSPFSINSSRFEIINQSGQLCRRVNLHGSEIGSVDIESLAAGHYILLIYSKEGKVGSARFTKK